MEPREHRPRGVCSCMLCLFSPSSPQTKTFSEQRPNITASALFFFFKLLLRPHLRVFALSDSMLAPKPSVPRKVAQGFASVCVGQWRAWDQNRKRKNSRLLLLSRFFLFLFWANRGGDQTSPAVISVFLASLFRLSLWWRNAIRSQGRCSSHISSWLLDLKKQEMDKNTQIRFSPCGWWCRRRRLTVTVMGEVKWELMVEGKLKFSNKEWVMTSQTHFSAFALPESTDSLNTAVLTLQFLTRDGGGRVERS